MATKASEKTRIAAQPVIRKTIDLSPGEYEVISTARMKNPAKYPTDRSVISAAIELFRKVSK